MLGYREWGLEGGRGGGRDSIEEGFKGGNVIGGMIALRLHLHS